MPRSNSKDEASISLGNEILSLSQKGKDLPFRNINTLEIPPDKFGCSLVAYGSTRSGKTCILNYLYQKFFKDYISVLMSNSLQSDSYKLLKKTCVTSDMYHPELIKEMYKINHATNNHYKFCVIIDDISDHNRDRDQIVKLFTLYRNSRISTFLCAQASTMLNKTCRTNINYVLLGRLNNDAEIEQVIKNYLTSFFPTRLYMAEKISLYRQLTDDHHWICIDMIGNDIFRTKLTAQQLLT